MKQIIERLKTLEARIYAADTHEAAKYYGQLQDELVEAWPKLLAVVARAEALRAAQKAYMADRGNEELGRAVGKAATELDDALAALEEDK